ncbi:protein phosphatase 1 regulatory subunit 3C [Aplochiton taeniatus]
MNSTKLLHALGSGPLQSVMPAALSLCQTEPLYHLLGMSPRITIAQPCNQSRDCTLTRVSPSCASSSSSSSSERQGCFRRDSSGLKKKRVVFADAMGLALTAVRFFIPEIPHPALVASPSPTQLSSPSPTLNFFRAPSPTGAQVQQWPSLGSQVSMLAFPPPTVSSKTYSGRPLDDLVQLESCFISELSLSGTVRVFNVGLPKAVYVRVTWNSWRSHRDFSCVLLPPGYGDQETDLFAFDVALPQHLDPNERLEFRVFSRPSSGPPAQWNHNGGQSDSVWMESEGSKTIPKSLSRRSPSRTLHRPRARSRVKNYTDISPDMMIDQSSGRL